MQRSQETVAGGTRDRKPRKREDKPRLMPAERRAPWRLPESVTWQPPPEFAQVKALDTHLVSDNEHEWRVCLRCLHWTFKTYVQPEQLWMVRHALQVWASKKALGQSTVLPRSLHDDEFDSSEDPHLHSIAMERFLERKYIGIAVMQFGSNGDHVHHRIESVSWDTTQWVLDCNRILGSHAKGTDSFIAQNCTVPLSLAKISDTNKQSLFWMIRRSPYNLDVTLSISDLSLPCYL